MSNREKAAGLLSKLYSISYSRSLFALEVEDILEKCSSQELDFYYTKLIIEPERRKASERSMYQRQINS